jgi:hypothetical protein
LATIKPIYKSKLVRNPTNQKAISLRTHAHPKHSQLKFFILLVHCVHFIWVGVTNDEEEGRGAKCKRIQGPGNGSLEDPIFTNDVEHLQYSNEVRFKCCRIDVEGGWHCLYSWNYPTMF